MSIRRLENPKTELYLDFKEKILSSEFKWVYSRTTTDDLGDSGEYGHHNMYAHCLLGRPGTTKLYPQTLSKYLDHFNDILIELFNFNRIEPHEFNVMIRANVNAVNPQIGKVKYSIPHMDHEFSHKNMLIYLTDAGGSTFVEGEEFAPEEDDVIVFEGMHWHKLPKEERRVVLVMTYI